LILPRGAKLARGDFAARWRLAMEVQGGKDGTAEKKKRTKRGRWTPERRQEIVAASFVEGASINEVAQRFGIRPNLLTAWRRRQAREIVASKPKSKRTRFAAVRIKAVAMDGTIEIDQASGLVRVSGIVDAGVLREVLAAIR
jgi:transposase